jgi:hypothetical protein
MASSVQGGEAERGEAVLSAWVIFQERGDSDNWPGVAVGEGKIGRFGDLEKE